MSNACGRRRGGRAFRLARLRYDSTAERSSIGMPAVSCPCGVPGGIDAWPRLPLHDLLSAGGPLTGALPFGTLTQCHHAMPAHGFTCRIRLPSRRLPCSQQAQHGPDRAGEIGAQLPDDLALAIEGDPHTAGAWREGQRVALRSPHLPEQVSADGRCSMLRNVDFQLPAGELVAQCIDCADGGSGTGKGVRHFVVLGWREEDQRQSTRGSRRATDHMDREYSELN